MSALLEVYVAGVIATTILCGVNYAESDGLDEFKTLVTVLAWPVFWLFIIAHLAKLIVMKVIGR